MFSATVGPTMLESTPTEVDFVCARVSTSWTPMLTISEITNLKPLHRAHFTTTNHKSHELHTNAIFNFQNLIPSQLFRISFVTSHCTDELVEHAAIGNFVRSVCAKSPHFGQTFLTGDRTSERSSKRAFEGLLRSFIDHSKIPPSTHRYRLLTKYLLC